MAISNKAVIMNKFSLEKKFSALKINSRVSDAALGNMYNLIVISDFQSFSE